MTSSSCKYYILLFLSLSIVYQPVFSQNTVKIKGIVESAVHKPVDGATILLRNDQEVISQTVSNLNGTFSMTASPGKYRLIVTCLGSLSYKSEVIDFFADKDLGSIPIKTANIDLREVLVKGTRKKTLIQVEGRKLVYNIENSVTAQGSNVLEALKKTPGVMVSQDNVISLNGVNGTLVMINGRQTYLQASELGQLLKSMSASDIKSIEIIKNPSAEYDAAGSGGIINLVLQKLEGDGFNGSINNGVAYGRTLKQNTNLNLNLRSGKLNLFGGYNHNFGSFAMDYDNNRITNGKIYLNPNSDIDKRYRMGATLGADYNIDTTQTIGIVFNGSLFNGPGTIIPVTNIYDQESGKLLQVLKSQSSYYHQLANRYNSNVNYRYKDGSGHTLSLDADYGFFDSKSKNLNTNTFYSPEGEFQSANNFRVVNSKDIKLYAFKADYGLKLGRGQINIGAKYSSVSANNIFNQYKVIGDADVLDGDVSNTFAYKEQIAAGYLKYEGAISSKLSFDAGLRAENTSSDGLLLPLPGSSQEPVTIKRNYLNLFPTASLTYKTEKSGTYNLSFSRRIDRPAYNDLNPFLSPVDELSYWKGNPFLQPQYANSIALQYSYKNTIASFGYIHTTDLTGGVSEVADGNRIIMVPLNIGSQNNYNLNVTQQVKVNNWWNMSVTLIGYYLENKVGTVQYGYYNPTRLAGALSTQQTFKLPYQIAGEIAGVFNSKSLSGLNTYVRSSSQIDLGLQKNVMGDKGTLRLAVTDIYNGNRYNTDSKLNGLILHTTYRGEYRQVKLNFTYRFGNSKVKAKDSRESGLQNENQRL
ncbi:TonB-dependent receptor [Pedobacter sp. PAMC26386]|nr:TonB-dependent receptor [Pedobacter sp. PAMC26386]